MSEFKFPCPNCSQAIPATDDQAGRMVQCPTCKKQFPAPARPASACPPPLPSAKPPPLPTGFGGGGPRAGVPPVIGSAGRAASAFGSASELERQVLEGGRFVVFQYCVSVLIMTFKRASPVMFLRGDEDGARHALNYSLISLFAGWWGFPWGPIWTIATLISNAGGGKDLTQAVLTEKLGPARAGQIMGQRRRPSPKGAGLKALRWGLVGAALLPVLAVMGLTFAGIVGGQSGSSRALRPGEAQFNLANEQIEMNRGNAAFGNSPKAFAVATRFSASMKRLRAVLFEGGKPSGLSLSGHEFLTCCELQETQCVLIVHVPELRRFTDTAKASLGTLAWVTAQQALQSEQAGRPGMKLAVGLRGITLYDRVLVGTFAPESSAANDGLAETITSLHPEQRLFSWFQSAD